MAYQEMDAQTHSSPELLCNSMCMSWHACLLLGLC